MDKPYPIIDIEPISTSSSQRTNTSKQARWATYDAPRDAQGHSTVAGTVSSAFDSARNGARTAKGNISEGFRRFTRSKKSPTRSASAQAIKHFTIGFLQIVGGLLLVLLGIALLVLPGPGLLCIGGGVALIVSGVRRITTGDTADTDFKRSILQ